MFIHNDNANARIICARIRLIAAKNTSAKLDLLCTFFLKQICVSILFFR